MAAGTGLWCKGVGLVMGLGLAGSVWAQSVVVHEAWTRASAPGQQTAGVYLSLTASEAAALLGASGPAGTQVELHEMVLDGGVMKMRARARLALPAGQTVVLRPGSYHLMLHPLRVPLRAGEKLPLTLQVEGRDGQVYRVAVQAEVRSVTAGRDAAAPEHAAGHAHVH